MSLYQGCCHCGEVIFEVECDITELVNCNCSICFKRNAEMIAVNQDNFRLIRGEQALTEYRFHTQTARHFFCRHCGIYTHHYRRTIKDSMGINAHCLKDIDLTQFTKRLIDGKNFT